tara:strand:- start:1006 stop:1917 length:912 start_codon:yes stop_codon:yes gene_type:complete
MKFDFLSAKDQAYYIHKASTLVEALPYIRQHSGKKIVIKFGGHALADTKLAKTFSKDICLLKEIGIHPIILHGGGPQIGKMLKKKKIESSFFEGLRVTSKEMIKIVEDVLSKDINSKIVNDILKSGGKAIGLSGHKNGIIEAEKFKIKIKKTDSNIEKNIDIGFVGSPKKVNSKKINESLSKGLIPVISPLGKDNLKKIYNINADTAAGAIAGKMKASKLLLLTDVAGILDEKKKLIPSLSLKNAKKILKEKYISGGMKPKIETCINAISQGVEEATILDGRIPHSIILELFTEHGIGTQIYS